MSDRKPLMRLWLVLWILTLNDLELSYFKVIKLHVKYFENSNRNDDGVNTSCIGNLHRLAQ